MSSPSCIACGGALLDYDEREDGLCASCQLAGYDFTEDADGVKVPYYTPSRDVSPYDDDDE